MNKSKLLLLFIFLLLQQLLLGQSVATTKGADLWSASGSFASQPSNIYASFVGDRVKSINFRATYLHFLKDKLAFGPSFGLSRTGQNSNNTTGSWGVGPRLFYFADNGRPVFPYLGGGIDFVSIISDNTVPAGFGTQLAIGTMFRKDHLGVFFELGLQTQNVKGRSDRVKGRVVYFSVGFAGFLF